MSFFSTNFGSTLFCLNIFDLNLPSVASNIFKLLKILAKDLCGHMEFEIQTQQEFHL